jgi:hypothetical protein
MNQDEEKIAQIIDHQQEAWDHADAAGYAQDCDNYMSFTNIVGNALVGQAAFEERHGEVFSSIFMVTKMNWKFPHLFAMIVFAVFVGGCSGTGFAAPAHTVTPTLISTPIATPTTTTLPTASIPEPSADLTLTCFTDSHPTFTDYTTWTKVNSKPIDGHETKVNIYVNNLAKEVYLSASGEVFPVCATIVKTHLSIAADASETVTAVTVMVKMPDGFDPQHNDWWWGKYDAAGKSAEMNGKVQVCIACHMPAAAADYVFSQKVLEQSNK